MLNKTILYTFTALLIMACTTQNNSENNKDITTAVLQNEHKDDEPRTGGGMPPDEEAVRKAQEEIEKMAESKKEIIYLKEGENKFLKEYQMNITFKQMSEDSRCPKDVNCIWGGIATAEVEVMGVATRPMILKISTVNDDNKGYSTSQNFNRHRISLMEVSPETTSEKGFKALKGQYKIGIKIESYGGENPSVTTQ